MTSSNSVSIKHSNQSNTKSESKVLKNSNSGSASQPSITGIPHHLSPDNAEPRKNEVSEKAANDKETVRDTARKRRQALKRGQEALLANDWANAEQFARQAILLDPGCVAAYQIAFTAIVQSDTPERFTDILKAAAEKAEAEPVFRRLSLALYGLPRSEALSLVDLLIQRWPDSLSFRESRVLLCGSADDAKADTSTGVSHEAMNSAVHGHSATAVLLIEDQIEKAEKTDLKGHKLLLDIRQIIKTLPDPSEYKRPVISDDGSEFISSEATTSGDAVLFFSGLGRDKMIPLSVYDAFFAAADMSAIYVRDKTQSLGIGGIATLGTDRGETQQALRQRLKELQCRRLLVVGKSAGAYSAIQYGLEMSADRILAFSPPCDLNLEFLTRINDQRGKTLARRLLRQFGTEEISLSHQLAARVKNPPIDVHFGAEMPTDAAHASELAKYENITLHPIPGFDKHRSVFPYLVDGSFRQLLSW